MKNKINNKVYSIGVILLISMLAYGLKSYSDTLRNESVKELLKYNRSSALQKMSLAQIVWFPLRFDKQYQHSLKDIEQINNRPSLLIYLKEDYSLPKEELSKPDLNNFISQLEAIKGVKKVTYISSEQALINYNEMNKNNKQLLELTSPNILPQSIQVYLYDYNVINTVEDIAKSKPFVYQVLKSY
jgi:cell division protein FtsX